MLELMFCLLYRLVASFEELFVFLNIMAVII